MAREPETPTQQEEFIEDVLNESDTEPTDLNEQRTWLAEFMDILPPYDPNAEEHPDLNRAMRVCHRLLADCMIQTTNLADQGMPEVADVRRFANRVATFTYSDRLRNGPLWTDDVMRSSATLMNSVGPTPEMTAIGRSMARYIRIHRTLLEHIGLQVQEHTPNSPEAQPNPGVDDGSTEDGSTEDESVGDGSIEDELVDNRQTLRELSDEILDHVNTVEERWRSLPVPSPVESHERELMITSTRDELVGHLQRVRELVQLNTDETDDPESLDHFRDRSAEAMGVLAIAEAQVRGRLQQITRLVAARAPFVDPPATDPQEAASDNVVELRRLVDSSRSHLHDFIEALGGSQGVSTDVAEGLRRLVGYLQEPAEPHVFTLQEVACIQSAIYQLRSTPTLRTLVSTLRLQTDEYVERIGRVLGPGVPISSLQVLELMRHITTELVPPEAVPEPTPEAVPEPTPEAVRSRQEAITTLTWGVHPTPVNIPTGEAVTRALERASECPLCFNIWETSGTHRVVSLVCGHLFGRSCICRVIRRSNDPRCPLCHAAMARNDLRYIYPPLQFAARRPETRAPTPLVEPVAPAPEPAPEVARQPTHTETDVSWMIREPVIRSLRESIASHDSACVIRDRTYTHHSGLLLEMSIGRGDHSQLAAMARDSWARCLETQMDCDDARNKRDVIVNNVAQHLAH